MDALTTTAAAGDSRAIRFTGTWREYLPIAITNALLIVCTLGIYRFWATARQRRYLWSRTHFIDDSFEWTGTGKEMFIGFIIVMCVLAPFFLFIQFALPALVVRGKTEAAFGVLFLFEIAIFYLGGFARFVPSGTGSRGRFGMASAAAATIPAGITAASISAGYCSPR